jgi:hypothetical protein
MWRVLISVFVSLFIAIAASSQTLSNQAASDFISELSQESPELEEWVWPEELAISRRLGIVYSGVKHKFLISYKLSDDLKSKTVQNQDDLNVRIVPLEADYSKLVLENRGVSVAEYFFAGNRLIIIPASGPGSRPTISYFL